MRGDFFECNRCTCPFYRASQSCRPSDIVAPQGAGVEAITTADAQVLAVQHYGVCRGVKAIYRTNCGARCIGAVHAGHRYRTFAWFSVIKRDNAAAVDAPRYLVLVFTRASCAMVVRLPANARGRPVRSDRVRFGGKHCGATAIRVSAGSFRSLTSLTRNARCDAAGWSNPIERIRSLRIVRLFGLAAPLDPANLEHFIAETAPSRRPKIAPTSPPPFFDALRLRWATTSGNTNHAAAAEPYGLRRCAPLSL
jgi:hypothetical protein